MWSMRVLVMGLLLAVFVGCGERTVVVYGKLVRSSGGSPAAGGKVKVGAQEVTTNESGFFAISVPADTPLKMDVAVAGYAPSQKVFAAPAQSSTFVQVTLLPWEGQAAFDVAAGGSVSVGQTQLTFPPNALEGAGPVTVKMSTLDPSIDGERAAFPGGFETVTGQMLESFGAIAVEARAPDGGTVNLKSGQSASLRLETSGASSAASTLPLWSYDEAAGAWKEEGQLTACAAGLCQAQIPHLSWWNADQVYETTCLTVCARNGNGAAAVGVEVQARGVSYNGNSEGITGADGCACLDVRKSSQIEVVGLTSGGVVNPVRLSTAASTSTCSANRASCATLPTTLTVETPKFQAILTWAEDPSDLDSHFTGPCVGSTCDGPRFHVYYSQRGSLAESPFAYLDTDDTSGFGPEITTLGRCLAGTYRYSINRFSGSPGIEQSAARVLLLLPDGTLREKSPPASNPTAEDVWVVGDLTCDASCGCSWQDRDLYTDADGYDP